MNIDDLKEEVSIELELMDETVNELLYESTTNQRISNCDSGCFAG